MLEERIDHLDSVTERKKRSVAIRQIYDLLADMVEQPQWAAISRISNRMDSCGDLVAFKKNIDTQARKLYRANFCKARLCPMCAWRKSTKNFLFLNEVLKRAQNSYKGIRFVFLTLTIPNTAMTAQELKTGIQKLLKAYRAFIHHYLERYCPAYLGAFRNLEITVNWDTFTLHPHLHVILAVDESYFEKGSQSYITHETLVKVWADLIKEPTAIVSLEAVKEENLAKSLLELTKYTTKDEDIIAAGNQDRSAEVLEALHFGLKYVRSISYNGLLKEILKEVKESDLDPDADVFPELLTVIEFYRWNGFAAYNFVSERKMSEVDQMTEFGKLYDLPPDG